MNEYQKALIILKESATAKSKQNKLVKIAVTTEDVEFKNLLEDMIKGYSLYIPPRAYRRVNDLLSDIPRNYNEWVKCIEIKKRNLKNYIENILLQNKPQWQILAEKHGWKSNKVYN